MTDDRVRGLCPRCGDAQVIHHELGMPLTEAVIAVYVVWEMAKYTKRLPDEN